MKIHISLDMQEYPHLSISKLSSSIHGGKVDTIYTKEILKTYLIILSVIPVIMVGILGLYGF